MGGAGKGPGIGWSRAQHKYSWEANLYATHWFCADRSRTEQQWKIITSRTMTIFLRVCDSKAYGPFNCVLFKCYKFMKGRTGSALSRRKYVKYFSVGTSCYQVVLQKFIVTAELLYDQAEVILSNVKQDLQWILKKLNLIEIELFIKMLYGVWSSLQPDHETISAPDACQPSSQERWQVADLKHLKTSNIFSLPRISTKDFPFIKGKIDRSTGINYSSVNFKWTQVFLCRQSFDRRRQWIF